MIQPGNEGLKSRRSLNFWGKLMDSWCRPIFAKSGKRVSGGAARQVRLANYENGMDDIVADAVQDALRRADQRVRAGNMRLVKKSA